jgi:hypothetical protein
MIATFELKNRILDRPGLRQCGVAGFSFCRAILLARKCNFGPAWIARCAHSKPASAVEIGTIENVQVSIDSGH